MKTLILIASICLSTLSCSKENSKMEQLKANAVATVSGLKVTLDMNSSTGSDIVAYGWQKQANSPSPGNVTYYPKSSYTKSPGYDLITTPIVATTGLAGVYLFQLTIYDASGASDAVIINVETK